MSGETPVQVRAINPGEEGGGNLSVLLLLLYCNLPVSWQVLGNAACKCSPTVFRAGSCRGQNCPYQYFCHFKCSPLKMCKSILRDWADIFSDKQASRVGWNVLKTQYFTSLHVLHLLCLALSNCANIQISYFCQIQTWIEGGGMIWSFWSNK